jgi:hypothetical protein
VATQRPYALAHLGMETLNSNTCPGL